MSNELAISASGPLALPAHLQGVNLGVSTALLATMGQGGNRIGLKGNRFRQIVNGKEEGVWEENYLDVIVLGAVPAISRIFYEGTYDADTKSAPACYSADGIAPAEDVKSKQSTKCDLCPQNQKGSKIANGQKLKACSYFQRLVVMLAGDEEGVTYTLDVKAMGIFGESHANVNKYNIRDYVKFVANRGVDIGQLVTRLSFDTDSSVPKLLFAASRFIDAREFAVVADKVTSDEVRNMLRINMTTVDLSGEVDAVEPEKDAPDSQVQKAAAPQVQKAAAPPRPKPELQAAPAPKPKAKLSMTAKAEFTYQEYKDNGWTVDDLVAEGYAVVTYPEVAKPTAPPPPKAAPQAPPKPPAPAQAPKPAAAQAPVKQAPTKAQVPTVKKNVPMPAKEETVQQVQETTTDDELADILAGLE